MAKQDFLAGGFYGKLGNIVGQRWRNQRVARSYVIPEDPKTEKQLAWRSKFAAGIAATHVASVMDWDSPLFTNDNSSKQNQRQSACLERLKDDVTGLELIPLTPYQSVVPNPITAFYYTSYSSGQKYGILTATIPDNDITLAIVIGSTTEYPTVDNCHVFFATWNSTTGLVEIPETATDLITEGAYVRICSTSADTTSDNYYCSSTLEVTEWVKQEITLESITVSYDTTQEAVTVTLGGIEDRTATGTVAYTANLAAAYSLVTISSTETALTFTKGIPSFKIAIDAIDDNAALYWYATTSTGVTLESLTVDSLLYNFIVDDSVLTTYYGDSDVTLETPITFELAETTTIGEYTLVLQATQKGAFPEDGLLNSTPIPLTAVSNAHFGNPDRTAYELNNAILYAVDDQIFIAMPTSTPFPMISSYCNFPAQKLTLSANGLTVTLSLDTSISYYDSELADIYGSTLFIGAATTEESVDTTKTALDVAYGTIVEESTAATVTLDLIVPDSDDELAFVSARFVISFASLMFTLDGNVTTITSDQTGVTGILNYDNVGENMTFTLTLEKTVFLQPEEYNGSTIAVGNRDTSTIEIRMINPDITIHAIANPLYIPANVVYNVDDYSS